MTGRADSVVVSFLSGVACLIGITIGITIGMVRGWHDGQSAICRTECGDHWTLNDNRCVCLVVAP